MTDFEHVYQSYFKDVEHYLLALSKDAGLAEELASQVFFKALHNLESFRGQCDIRTWLFAVAKNCYLSHLRKTRRDVPLEEVCIADPGRTPEEALTDQQQAMQIHRLLHELPEPYKEVFSLRVFGQLSFAQIGSLFGKSQNWACVTYHRARQKIRREMEGNL